MSLKTYVGFVADFPSNRADEDASPPGRELADWVATRLKSAGLDVNGPEERGGWAWELSSQVDDTAIETIVGLVDDMEGTPPRQWLITNDSHPPLLQRWFGTRASRENRERSMRKFCEALHRLLTSDPRFSHVHWHAKETFDEPGAVPGDAP